MKTETGNLVVVRPGNYLTELGANLLFPAQVLLVNPTIGVVVDKISDRKIVALESDNRSCIFVKDDAMNVL